MKIKTQATIFVIVDTSEWDLDNVDPQTLHELVADALSAHLVVSDERHQGGRYRDRHRR